MSGDNPLYQALYSVAEHSSVVIQTIHETTGLPWWATVCATGFVVRTALMPLGVVALRNAARASVAGDAIRAVTAASQRAWAAESVGKTPSEKALLRAKLALLTRRGTWAAMRRAGCHPWLSFLLPFVQFPVYLAAVLGARHSVLMGDESFEREGLLWFTDLTVHDPYYIVPAAALSLGYLSLEVIVPRRRGQRAQGQGAGAGVGEVRRPVFNAAVFGEKLATLVRDVSQATLVLSLPFMSDLPSGLFLLMSTNSAWTIAYLTMVRNPAVQAYLLADIPLPGSGKARGVTEEEEGGSTLPPAPTSGGVEVGAAAGGVGEGSTGTRPGGHGKGVAPLPGARLPAASIEAAPTAGKRPLARGTHSVPAVVGDRLPSAPGPAPAGVVGVGVGLQVAPHRLSGAKVAQGAAAAAGTAAGVAAAPAIQSIPLAPGLSEFVHHMHMHPRFLYHADGPIDLAKEATFMDRIRTSFRKDAPWVGGSPAPFMLAVAGGDRRMPWFNSPSIKAVDKAAAAAGAGGTQQQAQAAKPAPLPLPELALGAGEADERHDSRVNALFSAAWATSVAVPIPGRRGHEMMRINPRLFTADRQPHLTAIASAGGVAAASSAAAKVPAKGAAAAAAATSSGVGGGREGGQGSGSGSAAGSNSGWLKIAVDDPLYILLPQQATVGPAGGAAGVGSGAAAPPARARGALPHSFEWPAKGGAAGLKTVPAAPEPAAGAAAAVQQQRPQQRRQDSGSGSSDAAAEAAAGGPPQADSPGRDAGSLPATDATTQHQQVVMWARSKIARSWHELLLHFRRGA